MTVLDYGYIRTTDELAKIVKAISARPDLPLGFDIETGYEGVPVEEKALAMHAGGFIVGFSFTVDTRWARYVPIAHDYLAENLDPDATWEIMQPLLEQKRVVAHNAKFEKRYMRTVGIEIGVLGDTMLQAYVLSDEKQVGLKELVDSVYGHKMQRIEELFPKGTKKKELKALRFNILGLGPDVVSYACEDSAWCLRLFNDQKAKIEAHKDRLGIYNLELEILEILCDLEDYGMAVDWDSMARHHAEADEFIAKYAAEVRADLGALLGRSLASLNLGSPEQLRAVLYNSKDQNPSGLGLPVVKYTDTGKPSTDAKIALKASAKKEPAVGKLLKLRELENLRKRFQNWLDITGEKKVPKYPVRGLDGKVHASYGQTIVGTGRFAANKPPIQQCPKKWEYELADGTKWEGNFRALLTSSPGHYLLGFDYSQIELRAIAGLAQERSLLEAFERGDDVHTLTAAMMLGKKVEDVDPDVDRPIGKTMNFALIYQMGWGSLSDRLAIPKQEARDLYDSYFANFPSIAAYVEKAKQEAKSRDKPHTLSHFGRKWTIWELVDSVSHAQYAKGERMAVNAPVQGWAADYMKISMTRATAFLKAQGYWGNGVMLVMNQHDAITFDVDEKYDPRELLTVLSPQVEWPLPGFPKIVAEWEFGYTWGGSKKLEADTPMERSSDGRWRLMADLGEIERDDMPEDEEDEEGNPVWGEVVGSLPDDVEEAFSLADAVEETALPVRTLMIQVARMPSAEEVHTLLRLLTSRPGANVARLKTPDGEIQLVSGTAFGVADAGEISVALPGVKVYHPEKSVDLDSLAEVL
jgi:DNA polymerase I-like protein with 3'-5' exonuclease and polymerase domains